MTAYNYSAMSRDGKTRRGVLEADTDRQVRSQLREQGLVPLDIIPVTANRNIKKNKNIIGLNKSSRIKLGDLTLLTRQLATLFAAGLPVDEALLACAEQTEKNQVKSIIIGVRSRVLEGHSLANALRNFPSAFPELYCATIAAGEQTGRLDVVLNRLADYVEQQQKIRQKVQHALIYPSMMMFVALSIVIFLLVFVVPKIIDVFNNNGQTLPTTTLILLGFSHFLKRFGLYCIALSTIFGYVLNRLLQRESFRTRWQTALLNLPILGGAIRALNTARYARTFGILFAAGVPVLEAMRVAATLVTNLPIRNAVTEAAARVREGMAIHLALKQTQNFSPMMIHLMASGEASGTLEQMLERAANNQDQNVAHLIDTSLTLFEPAIILVMGGIVLFIVLAILLPIFDLDQMVR